MNGSVINNMHYKYSIIIPVYNTQAYITDCLNSILNQTFKDCEVIIIDDGSTDDSLSVINKFDFKSLIGYTILSKENGGVSSARNFGLQHVKGEYVLFLDGDDSLEPNTLQLLEDSLKAHPNEVFDYICFTRKDVYENGKIEEKILVNYTFEDEYKILDRNEVIRDLLSFNNVSIAVTDKAFRVEFFLNKKKTEWFPIGRYYEDHLFMMDAVFRTNKVLVTKYKLYRYLIRKGSTMRTANMKIAVDYVHVIENVWSKLKKTNTVNTTNIELFTNHILVQIITFFQTLRNAGIKDDQMYKEIVVSFKLSMKRLGLWKLLDGSFNSVPKNILSKYIRSLFSNYLWCNNFVFFTFDVFQRLKNKLR